MKSVCAFGRYTHFCRLAPSPTPNQSARSERDQALDHLIPVVLRVRPRVEERRGTASRR